MWERTRLAARIAAVPWLYRYAPCGLVPDRLALYISGLLDRVPLGLAVAEVGCHLGGTSILAYRAMRRNGWRGTYTCFDTFSGFVADQFAADEARGTPGKLRDMFAANSVGLVQAILNQHRCGEIRLVQGNIVTIADELLEPKYAAVLLDMDLCDPTYEALKRFWPRLAAGGAIFVDDCPETGDWKARIAVHRFCSEMAIPEIYKYGMAVLAKPGTT